VSLFLSYASVIVAGGVHDVELAYAWTVTSIVVPTVVVTEGAAWVAPDTVVAVPNAWIGVGLAFVNVWMPPAARTDALNVNV
jgi:hypothetical protein